MNSHEEDDDIDEGPSKSLLKRQSHDLQELGEKLIGLPQAELDALPLPDILREAVQLARRITAHGGLYRQKQYIGKLMRKIDAEPIRAAIDAREERSRNAAREFHLLERWRSRLIDEPTTVEEFMGSYPSADRALITRLASQARHEKEANRPPKAARELFQVIETVIKRE